MPDSSCCLEPVSYAAVEEDCIYSGLVIEVFDDSDKVVSQLVSWCFEPSQLQRMTSGLNTNFTLSPSHHTTSHVFLAYLYSVGTQHGNLHPAG